MKTTCPPRRTLWPDIRGGERRRGQVYQRLEHKNSDTPVHGSAHWPNLWTIFEYPPEIRKASYTTNAIESLNSVIRAATKRRKVFPNDDSARNVIYLAIEQAAKKWTMPIQN